MAKPNPNPPPNPNPFQGLNMDALVNLVNLLQPPNEEKRPEVRFAEIMNIPEYIKKSYLGNILPYNKETQRLLSLENKRIKWSSVTDVKEIDDLIQVMDNHATTASDSATSNATEAEANLQDELYPVGTVLQLVIRLLAYSLHYRRCLSTVPIGRLTCALSAFSDYSSVMLDLSNPFTTLPWNGLIDFMTRTQNLLKLPFNPFGDPTAEAQVMVSGVSPFAINGGAIQPLDTNVSFIENVYRQAAGEYRSFEQNAHIRSFMFKFGFKEYVALKIPMKRVINGAYTCYVDPLSRTYYYTTLSLDPFRFKVLKNLLIYEIVSGKSAYIHSALYFFMSMCTCEEDFKLMIKYGVIEWDFPLDGYACFCEKMKELLDVMYCWKISSTYTMHLEMIKIAKWKAKNNDTSPFGDFAVTCYAAGLLKKDVSATLYSKLN